MTLEMGGEVWPGSPLSWRSSEKKATFLASSSLTAGRSGGVSDLLRERSLLRSSGEDLESGAGDVLDLLLAAGLADGSPSRAAGSVGESGASASSVGEVAIPPIP